MCLVSKLIPFADWRGDSTSSSEGTQSPSSPSTPDTTSPRPILPLLRTISETLPRSSTESSSQDDVFLDGSEEKSPPHVPPEGCGPLLQATTCLCALCTPQYPEGSVFTSKGTGGATTDAVVSSCAQINSSGARLCHQHTLTDSLQSLELSEIEDNFPLSTEGNSCAKVLCSSPHLVNGSSSSSSCKKVTEESSKRKRRADRASRRLTQSNQEGLNIFAGALHSPDKNGKCLGTEGAVKPQAPN